MAELDMDNMTDEEFEAAMNKAIAEDETPAGEEAIVDEVNNAELDENLDIDETVEADEVKTDDNKSEQNQDESSEDDGEESEELEQPGDGEGTTDSNDDDTDGEDEDKEDDKDSEDEDDVDESDEDQDTKDTEDEIDEKSEELDEAETKPEEQAQPRKIRADGVEYEFTQDETDRLAEKGINYTKKMQAIAPYRKRISAMEENNVSEQDFNLMIDVLKGDKDAIASVLKRTGVEALDLDTDSEVEFKPKDYGKSTAELDIEEITSSISQDKEYAITHNVISKQWDDDSRNAMFDNPQMIAQLHTDVKSGMYDKVYPVAMKMKVFGDGTKSDLDYYKIAGKQVIDSMNKEKSIKDEAIRVETETKAQAKVDSDKKAAKIAKVKADEKKRKQTKDSAAGRKSAATTNSSAGTKGVIDYLDMDNLSDDEFSAMMDKEIRKK